MERPAWAETPAAGVSPPAAFGATSALTARRLKCLKGLGAGAGVGRCGGGGGGGEKVGWGRVGRGRGFLRADILQ